MAQADFDAIRARAYKLLEEAGKPQGRIDVFWYEAEQQLKKRKARHKLRRRTLRDPSCRFPCGVRDGLPSRISATGPSA
jgi:hypothetical protein